MRGGFYLILNPYYLILKIMYRKYVVFFAIFLVYLISVFIRFQILDHRAEAYDSLPFSNESAQHFIYTKVIAETGNLPVVDNKIQYPENINIRKKVFVFMEYFYGYLYRISTFLGKFQLTSFIRHIIPLLFSLSIIAVFILAYNVSKNRVAALISSAYYGVMLPSVLETTGEIFLKQTFALPLIFLNLSLLFFISNKPRYKTRLFLSILAGLLLYVAIISWDLTQLYLGVLFGSVAFLIIMGSQKNKIDYLPEAILKRDKEQRAVRSQSATQAMSNAVVAQKRPGPLESSIFGSLRRCFSVMCRRGHTTLVASCTDLKSKTPNSEAYSFATPSKSSSNYLEFIFIGLLFMMFAGFTNIRLREIGFLYSHVMLFGYSIVAIAVLKAFVMKLDRLKTLLLLLGVFAFLEVINSFVLKNQFSTYSHITSLFLYKLRFLGVKPANPALLPFDVNFMWLPADITPSLIEIVTFFSSTLFIGITAFILFFKGCRRRNSLKEDILLISLTLLFLIFYLLFARMSVFLIFFLCCSISLIYKYIPKKLKTQNSKFKIQILVTALLLMFLPFEYIKTAHICKKLGFIEHPSSLMNVCEWLKKNTSEDSPIATNFSVAGFIRLYADRPVLIHARVESDDIRNKIKNYMYSMFSRDETELWRFCQDRDANYLVYTMGTYITRGVYSWRYITGNLRFDEAITAFKLEFKPEELKKFELKYKNRYYKVYKIFSRDEIEEEDKIRKAVEAFKKARMLDYTDSIAKPR